MRLIYESYVTVTRLKDISWSYVTLSKGLSMIPVNKISSFTCDKKMLVCKSRPM